MSCGRVFDTGCGRVFDFFDDLEVPLFNLHWHVRWTVSTVRPGPNPNRTPTSSPSPVVEHPFPREDFLISSKMKCTTFILNHGHCCWRAVPKLAGDKQFDRFLLFPFVASFKIFLNLCANKKSLSLFLAGLLRCGKSCRLRWTNYLRPNLKRGVLSESEEQLIIDLHSQLGNRWFWILCCTLVNCDCWSC